MEKLPMCRLCLVKNVRMYIVANRNLHELYEMLTDVPFVTEDRRPMLACFFCYAKLKQCYRLLIQCLEAEDFFAQKKNDDYEPDSLINQDRLKIYGGFIKSATKNISIIDVVQKDSSAIKEEFPAVCEGLDNIIEPKEEHQSDEREPDNLDNSCVDLTDISPHYSVSNSENGVPLIEFTTEVEEAQEISKKKRRASETTRATVAKKPKLDTRRTILEDAIPAEPTKKVKSDSKVTRTAQKRVRMVAVESEKALVDANFHIVDTKIDLVGFTPTSSPGRARSAVSSSPTASTSSVPDEPSIFEDVEDEIAAWERSIVEMPGSDVEEDDLQDMEAGIDIRPRQRLATEFPAELEDLAPEQQGHLAVLDACDDSALRNYVSSEDMLHFTWLGDVSTFTGEREVFTGLSGPTFETDGMTPLDIFERIWDESIINHIVAETNRYANHLFVNPNLLHHSRIRKWRDITPTDLWTFFGIVMWQSIIPNSVEKEYWQPRFPYMRIGNFNDLMSYKKFCLIKKCLHFVDNSTIAASSSKLAKISPVIDHLNRKFSNLYLPEQNIAIDESLLLWKGKLSFVQLIANKAARLGIKSHELCESRTGYLWKFEINAGKGHQTQFDKGCEVETGSNEPEDATSQIVYRLVRPLLNKGHTLVMDNFYNSPLLSRTLKAQKTDTIGTLRLNREFVPDSLRSTTRNNMRSGEMVFSYTEDLSIVVWRDSNLVSLISTYHKVEVSGAEKYGVYKYKPKVVLDYNLSMGGVDKKDKLLQAYPVERIRNSVWYKKLFRRLFNVSIHNAYVIYSHKKKILHREFRQLLADEILRKHSSLTTPTPVQAPSAGHFPVKATGRARCKQCAKNYIECRTTWACDTCGARLCITCFRSYHTS